MNDALTPHPMTPEDEHDTTCARFRQHQNEAYAIFCARHRSYGAGNIARSGSAGVLIRMADKFARLETGSTELDESVADTHYDLANYAIIRLMVLEGSWPEAGIITARDTAVWQQAVDTIGNIMREVGPVWTANDYAILEMARNALVARMQEVAA